MKTKSQITNEYYKFVDLIQNKRETLNGQEGCYSTFRGWESKRDILAWVLDLKAERTDAEEEA